MKKRLIQAALIISALLFLAVNSQAADTAEAVVTDEAPLKKITSEVVVTDEAPSEKITSETVVTDGAPTEKVTAETVATGEAPVKKMTIEAVAVKEESAEVDAAKSSVFYNKYIKDHLQIGTRSVYRILTDDDSGHRGGVDGSGTFLGTIYGLKDEQNLAPIFFRLSYFFNKYIGLQLSYDKIEVMTKAYDPTRLVEKTDGNVSLAGPTVSLLTRFDNATKFTPFLGIGLGFYSASFDADPEWTLATRYQGEAFNEMEVEDETGWYFLAGVDWLFAKNLAVDLTFQYTKVDVDATYTGYYHDESYTVQEGHFPLDNIAIGLGLAYHF